jgi:diguanylate cyclase (GGDEF)-like protein
VRVSPLPYAATVATWGTVVYAARHQPVFPLLGVLVGGLLLTFLVFARQIFAVNAHAELMTRYQELAGTDSLTGIYNRRRFLEEAERELARTHRSGESVSLLMIDVDHFKVVNDRHGHIVGDAALEAVANDLRGALREGDLLGRCGGDEFVALLPGCDAEQAVTVADRVQARRVREWEPDGTEPIQLGLSIGVATAQLATLDSLLVRADEALYEAKEAGRGCTRFAAPERIPPPPIPTETREVSGGGAPPPGTRDRATDAR